ncbi:MAG TPA: nitrite reductase (NAD(P)H) small subunit [Nakamurella multipartita]|nr:nitrite reductase (NAD(P)H) small subunit [Nakamurella multipartita]
MNTDASNVVMVPICPVAALAVERGAAALLPDGTQIGVFLLEDGSVHAVQQHDPYSGTNILSRGLVGSHQVPGHDGAEDTIVPTLSSPMYKQVWNLDTGEVIDAGGGHALPIDVFDVQLRDGQVHVAATPRPRTTSDHAR